VAEHVGRSNIVQIFFKGEFGDWAEHAPPTLPQAKKSKHEGAAVQIYKEPRNPRPVSKPEEGFRISRVVLQSPYLRDALKDTLESYGISYKDKTFAESVSPHKGLFFALDRIAKVGREADETTRAHCELLCSIIEEIFSDILDVLDTLDSEHKITFDLLWTLFPPGLVCATQKHGFPPIGIKITNTLDERGSFKIFMERVQFDGYRYGTYTTTASIYAFEGAVDLSAIPVVPFLDLTKDRDLRTRLLERGKKALDMQTIRYMTYRPKPSDEDNAGQTKTSPWQRDTVRSSTLRDSWIRVLV